MTVNPKRADPIWTRPAPGTRRPRFSREQIAAAALAIADSEGYAAVSMRRVADALGAATMTLYYYVRTKEDLVALMNDALMGEVLVPDAAIAAGWREGLKAIAYRTRDVFLAHPWALRELKGTQLGPNTLRHIEQTLAALADAPLEDRIRFDLLTAIDDFVFGHALRSLKGWNGPRDDADGQASVAFMREQIAGGDFPHLSRMFADHDPFAEGNRRADASHNARIFERGLDAILDAALGWAAPVAPTRARHAATAPAKKAGRSQARRR